MEKRLPLALLLSFLVLLGWSVLTRPQEGAPPAPAAGRQAAGAAAGPQAEAPSEPASAPFEPIADVVAEQQERTLELTVGTPGERGSFHAVFTNRGARLLSLRLGDQYVVGGLDAAGRADVETWVPIAQPIELPGGGVLGSLDLVASVSARDLLGTTPLEEALWSMRELTGEEGAPRGVEFVYAPGSGAVLTKRIEFVAGTRNLRVTLALENVAGNLREGLRQFRFAPVVGMPLSTAKGFYREPKAVVARIDGGDVELDVVDRKDKGADDPAGALPGTGRFSFAGVHNKYFAGLLHPTGTFANTVIGAGYRRHRDLAWSREHPEQAGEDWRFVEATLDLQLFLPGRGEGPREFVYELYAGPKQRDEMVSAYPPHEVILDKDLGFFASIARLILGILGFYHALVGNWGWAIVLMTLTIRALLFPINRRSQTAMARYQKKMKRVQPKLDEIKQRYAKDPAKLRQEQARIMQEEGAFPPLGGCLPLFLQMPVFIGLFAALRVAFELRQAPFLLWIGDLSLPDRLLRLDLDTHLPIIGTIEYLNVLPIVMVVLWIWQQRSTPQPTDEQAARMQKMMMWMPVVFGFLLYNYAAGLSLYMITSSGVAVLETRVIRKVWPIDDSEQVRKKGWFAKLAERQREQIKRMEELQRQQRRHKQRAKAKRR